MLILRFCSIEKPIITNHLYLNGHNLLFAGKSHWFWKSFWPFFRNFLNFLKICIIKSEIKNSTERTGYIILILVEKQLRLWAKPNFWRHILCRISIPNSFNIKHIPPALAGPLVVFYLDVWKFFSTSIYIFFYVCVVSQVVRSYASPLCWCFFFNKFRYN